MKRKRKAKQKRKALPSSALIILLTPEAVSIAQAAIHRFAQPLERVTSQGHKLALAIEGVKQVSAKLEAMRTAAEQLRWTTFDANEKAILVAAVQLYSLDLSALPASQERTWGLDQCRQIIASFAPDQSNAQAEGEKRP
jgi:hypothetical protein